MTKEEEIIELKQEVLELRDDLKESQDKAETLSREVADLEYNIEQLSGLESKADSYDEHEELIGKIEGSKIDAGNMISMMKLEWILDNWDGISFDVRQGCFFK